MVWDETYPSEESFPYRGGRCCRCRLVVLAGGCRPVVAEAEISSDSSISVSPTSATASHGGALSEQVTVTALAQLALFYSRNICLTPANFINFIRQRGVQDQASAIKKCVVLLHS
jgi:hypothetical protein